MKIELSEIIDECEFTLQRGDRDIRVCGVSTDSRDINVGEVFVALTGERYDGHDFVEDAVTQGAAAVVVEAGRLGDAAIDTAVITVPDTLEALGRIARFWRRRCDARVIAITGSAGKTTTRAMVEAILRRTGTVTAAVENENNEIGVPQTMLRMDEDDDFCVLEFGMRGEGEIDYLASISEPDVGVITNIGEAHIGRLGSREAVAEAKVELLPHLAEDGAAVLNTDDFFFPLLSQMSTAPVISFGTKDADVVLGEVELIGTEASLIELQLPSETMQVRLPLPGRHNAMNAAAAAAVATALDIPADDLVAGLEAVEGETMRSQVIAGGDIAIIHDAYNASPTSVPPALEVLAQAQGRRVFVFGDMLELGPTAEQAHRRMGRVAVERGVDVLIAVGDLAEYAARETEAAGVETHRATDAQEAAQRTVEIACPGDTILVKASRGMHLETVVEALL